MSSEDFVARGMTRNLVERLISRRPGEGQDLIGTPLVSELVESTHPSRGKGAKWYAEGFAYTEAAPDATDHHLTTAGGVKLYVEQEDGVVCVKAFGARSNGSTDDTAAIQAALDSGHSRISLPTGVCKITSALNIPSDVEFYGMGEGSILKLSANAKILSLSGKSNVSVHDMTLDGQRATYTANTNDGVSVGWTSMAGSNVKLRNLHIRDMGGAGIIALASSGAASSGLTIEGCTVENTGTHGVLAQDYISDVIIRGNTVKNSGLGYADRPGITAGRFGKNIIVSDNICIGSPSALGTSAHGISIDRTANVTCHGNIIANAIGYGIEIGGVTNGSFQGNNVTGCTRAGIGMSANQGQFKNANVAIIGNTFNNSLAQGIYIFINSADGSWFNENVVVSGNVVHGSGSGQSGIDIRCVDGLTLTNNVARNCNLSGAYLDNCKRIMVSGNNFTYNNCVAVKSITSITLSGSTATVTCPSHGYSNGDIVTIFGAQPVRYQGAYSITVTGTDTFTFVTGSGLTSPAVGALECSKINSAAHAGIIINTSLITTKESACFGFNLIENNGYRNIYDLTSRGIYGHVNDMLILREVRGVPPAALLTSANAPNERDRVALFMMNDKLTFAYNNAGTTNYAVLDLDGSDTTWANGPASP